MAWTNENKSADPTWQKKIRRGRDIQVGDIGDLTFEDDMPDIEGGTTDIKDTTFETLSDQSWANKDKSTNPTWANETRS